MPDQVCVTGGFDDLRAPHVRFLEEASRLGELTVLLWPDDALREMTGRPPKFSAAERLYFLNALRYVSRVVLVRGPIHPDELPEAPGYSPSVWVVGGCRHSPARQAFARARGIQYRVLDGVACSGYPSPPPTPALPGRKKVIVTGCYDWLHTGHIRFFEEASTYGDLYVGLGNDANIEALKGPGHPLIKQDERRYMVGSIRYVKHAFISSGSGLLDADPEIRQLRPDLYVVNEDGDRGGKREYCQQLGIEYRVLKRVPAPGLPARSSTELRGF